MSNKTESEIMEKDMDKAMELINQSEKPKIKLRYFYDSRLNAMVVEKSIKGKAIGFEYIKGNMI